jgi:diaminopimelate epimerase
VIDEPVADVDLGSPRVLAPDELAGGANVEIVRAVGPREIEMRVHERGSGLTLSCGTGAVAAAVAAAAAVGEWPDGPGLPWSVDVPGGRLTLLPSSTASLLTGPAELVAVGELSDSWLADRSPVGLGAS